MILKNLIHSDGFLRPMFSPALRVRRSWIDFKLASGRQILDRLADGSASDIVMRVGDYQGDFSFPPRSHLLRRILETGAYEPELARLFASLVQPDRDVIDVGANSGCSPSWLARW